MPEEKAPWDDPDVEFDKDKATRYLNNLLSDKKKLQDRLATQKQGSDSKYDALQRENDTLKLQLHTGLNDKQVARLVGDSYEEKLKDAEEYAAETGIELRDFLDPDADTPDPDDQGGEGDQDGDEGEKQVNRDFRAPRRSGQELPPPDYANIVKHMDLGI